MSTSRKHILLGLTLSFVVMLLDQASKWYLLEMVDIANRPPIEITSFFNLVMVWNRGVSFGLFSQHSQPLLLSLLALVIIAVLLRWLFTSTDRLVTIGVGCVVGGAIGNVIDRARFGAVADFFDFHVVGYHWPSFNIADSAIFIGVVVLCIQSMMCPSKKP